MIKVGNEEIRICIINVYFGEITFYHESGYGVFTPKEWDTTMGSWLTLPTEASYL